MIGTGKSPIPPRRFTLIAAHIRSSPLSKRNRCLLFFIIYNKNRITSCLVSVSLGRHGEQSKSLNNQSSAPASQRALKQPDIRSVILLAAS